jgi:hypothetical protein
MKYIIALLALPLSSCLPFDVTVTLGDGQSMGGEAVIDYSAKGGLDVGFKPVLVDYSGK